MKTLYLSFEGKDGFYAKTEEIDNQTHCVIISLFPHIKNKEKFEPKLIIRDDVCDIFTIVKIDVGIYFASKDGAVFFNYEECEKIFIENCSKVEYFGETYELAKKLDLAFANDGVEYTCNESDKKKEEIRSIISDNFDKYNNSINTFREIEKIAKEILSTLKKKNDDYGNSYIKNIERFGKQAMLIPMFNKLDRLESLSKKENQNFESFEDSLKDLIGYCLMATEYLKRSK